MKITVQGPAAGGQLSYPKFTYFYSEITFLIHRQNHHKILLPIGPVAKEISVQSGRTYNPIHSAGDKILKTFCLFYDTELIMDVSYVSLLSEKRRSRKVRAAQL